MDRKKPEDGVTWAEAHGWAKDSNDEEMWIPACHGATIYKCPCGRPVGWHWIHGLAHLKEGWGE